MPGKTRSKQDANPPPTASTKSAPADAAADGLANSCDVTTTAAVEINGVELDSAKETKNEMLHSTDDDVQNGSTTANDRVQTTVPSSGGSFTAVGNGDKANGGDGFAVNSDDNSFTAPQSVAAGVCKMRRFDDLDDILASADESEIDPLQLRDLKDSDIEKDAVSGSNVLELDDDGDRWSKDFDRDSQSPMSRKKGSTVRGIVIGILLLALIVGAAAVAILFHQRLKADVVYEFYFARYFGNHMVLQRAPSAAVVWGYLSPIDGNTTVRVTLESADGTKLEYRTVSRYTAAGPTWRVTLDPVSEPGPFNITASLENHPRYVIRLHDVLFGDVWLCVGRNKMHYTVEHLLNATGDPSYDESFKEIRLFSVFQAKSDMVWYDLRGVTLPWFVPRSIANPVNSKTMLSGSYFPAVCWLFGKHLHKQLQRPIGLISVTNSDVSCLDEWVPYDVMDACSVQYSDSSTRIWNAMINPLLEMPFKGVIWHHGEPYSAKGPRNQSCMMMELIHYWRQTASNRTFNSTDPLFPVGIVQQPPRGGIEENRLSEHRPSIVRWQQTANYGYLPNPLMPRTFLAVTIDLPDSISNETTHISLQKRHKHEIVNRLMLGAMNVAYGHTNTIFQGPWPLAYSMTLKETSRLLTLFFNTSVSVPNYSDYTGFEICCSTSKTQFSCDEKSISSSSEWFSTQIATVPSSSNSNTVTLSISSCPNRRYVVGLRYSWREEPCLAKQCPIYSSPTIKHGTVLPMPPFIHFGVMLEGGKHEFHRSPVSLLEESGSA